ncbi:MAG: hypothetical protein ACJA0H_002126 [Francisellaceae bacterium]
MYVRYCLLLKLLDVLIYVVNDRKTKTISYQLTEQRKYYSRIDNRVPPVESKGRNKKI